MSRFSLIRPVVLAIAIFTSLPAQQITSLGVIDFDARGIASHEAASLTDWLRAEIVKIGVAPVAFAVERGNMLEVIIEEPDLQITGCTTDACAVRIGRLLGVTHMVAGSFGKVGSVYAIISRLIDVETGQIVNTANRRFQGSIEGLFNEMTPLAHEIVGMKEEYDRMEQAREEELARYRASEELARQQEIKRREEERARLALMRQGEQRGDESGKKASSGFGVRESIVFG